MLLVAGQQTASCARARGGGLLRPGAVLQLEQPFFTSAASLSAFVVPATGHDVAQSPAANLSFAAISDWLTAR